MNPRSAASGKPEPKATKGTSAKSSASTKTEPASGSAAYRSWSINTEKKSTPLTRKSSSENIDFSKWTESTDHYQHVRPELGKVLLSTQPRPSRLISALIPVTTYKRLQARSTLVNELAVEVLRLALRKPVNDPVAPPDRDSVCTIMIRVNAEEHEKLVEIADRHFGGNIGMTTRYLFSTGPKKPAPIRSDPLPATREGDIVEPVSEFVVNDPDWPSADDILRARTDLNLSQTKLAKKTGMSRRTLRCHEGGIRSLQRVRMLIMRTCMAMGYKPELPPTTS